MSNFTRKTKHPVTGKCEEATWMDGYFGRHHYGVSFLGDSVIYDSEKIDMPECETTKDCPAGEVIYQGPMPANGTGNELLDDAFGKDCKIILGKGIAMIIGKNHIRFVRQEDAGNFFFKGKMSISNTKIP